MKKTIKINRTVAKKVLSIVDAGLSNGLGKRKPGEMCAVYAAARAAAARAAAARAADAAYAAKRDSVLSQFAEEVVQILVKMKVKSASFLNLARRVRTSRNLKR